MLVLVVRVCMCCPCRRLCLPLLALAPAAPLSLEGVPVYRGLRLAMGMTGGRLVEVRPCGRSGKAEFFGPLLNQAARIASMANGGQVRRRRVAGRAD